VNAQVWWYVARSSGIVAWALSALAIGWGLALSTRAVAARPAWLLDLHRFLGALTVAFTGAHIGALVADSYVHFGVADLLVPMASSWRPGAVAWGIVALYVLIAVELSSLAMKRLPRKLWRAVHMTSYLLFGSATVHAFTAGADSTHPWMRISAVLATAAIAFFTIYRGLAPKRRRSLTRAQATA
jgi:DMSO/TMAO reductase YedYZ heme-binding membrane subunit